MVPDGMHSRHQRLVCQLAARLVLRSSSLNSHHRVLLCPAALNHHWVAIFTTISTMENTRPFASPAHLDFSVLQPIRCYQTYCSSFGWWQHYFLRPTRNKG